ncbi:pyrroline-5-carboxylate reductase [Methyloversatilis thermotolerans]|uniref:pyrroline-5-carboxylate reductase n=1 Tax=Methyloversatilis thermotolerans TaxID=1346290 RepID=UPI000363E27F|nr:pyrroline-5-carboxylate reductase [Methyloversatilis thermotolerans]
MKITFVGGGNMASALIGGLLARGASASDLCVIELQAEARARLGSDFGVRTAAALDEDAAACDLLVLAVKPQQMREVCAGIAGRMSGQTVLSIAAGLRVADLSRWLGGHGRIVRAMPNTPALIGQGVTGLYADPALGQAVRDQADQVLRAVGSTVWVDDEKQIDAVTAVSGSGPAYVFYFIESMVRGGEALGLSASQARDLALATFTGAAALAAGSPDSPATLRERVTSKGGTTEAALESMAADQVSDAIVRALAAAATRGAELGDRLGRA